MADLGARMAAGLWAVAAGAAAWAVWKTDALVAVGFERFTGPLAFALLHVPAAVMLELARRGAARFLPRAASLLAPLVPAVVIVVVWMPGLVDRSTSPAPRVVGKVSGPDIVLITLDTVRADHVGAISGGELTPHLDHLAGRGAVFTQAITASPLTTPAHATLLTGLEVPDHQLWVNGGTLAGGTVVEELRAAGYRTGAFVSAHALDRETGVHRGFQHFDDRWGMVQRLRWLPLEGWFYEARLPPRRSGAQTVDQALRWVYQDDSPAFVWVHLYDAHGPYAPPSQFSPSEAAMAEARRLDREDVREASDVSVVGWTGRTRVRQQRLLYAASVSWVDALVGRLVGRLRGEPIVIVVGDHGESLGEHGYYFSHGDRVSEPVIRVPLVVRWPGRYEAGLREPGLVSTRSVAGLLLQAAGIEPVRRPGPELSVLSCTSGQDPTRSRSGSGDREEPRPTAALRFEGEKLVARQGEPVTWYDLVADPQEEAPQPVPERLVGEAARLEKLVNAPPPRVAEHQAPGRR